ncbi:MAG: nucleotidyltransferase family protein [Desulfobacterales bacterium]
MDILDELKTLTKTLRAENIEYALCGGLALAIYALPRATLDIDILIEKNQLERVEKILYALDYR